MAGDEMKLISEFISEYGMTIIYAVITAIAGFIAAQVKKLYQEKIDTEVKKKVVETCVKAVEQLYKDTSGAEKLERAKANIVLILQEKGINITELELDMLIESVVAEFNFYDLRIDKKEAERIDEDDLR